MSLCIITIGEESLVLCMLALESSPYSPNIVHSWNLFACISLHFFPCLPHPNIELNILCDEAGRDVHNIHNYAYTSHISPQELYNRNLPFVIIRRGARQGSVSRHCAGTRGIKLPDLPLGLSFDSSYGSSSYFTSIIDDCIHGQ